MSKLKRLLHLLAAFLSLGAATAIFIVAGLPSRSDFSGQRGPDDIVTAPEAGAQAPPFMLPTLSGSTLALDQVRGRFTIINFWATWCQPCRREMRDLQRLYDSNQGRLRVLAVNLGESLQAARRWANELGLNYTILLDTSGAVASMYQVRGLPATYLLDGEQRIRRQYYGPVRLEQLQRDLDQFGART